MTIKCKRIIDSKTYNTETATLIAGNDDTQPDEPWDAGEHLYQTRFGAFFLCKYFYWNGEDDYEKIVPFTPDQAREWLETNYGYRVDLIEKLFGEMPEAGSGESKFTLRMPDSLRDRLANRAKANNQSLNAWIVRCLESFAAEPLPEAEDVAKRDTPPMSGIVGSNRSGWRTRRG